MGKKNIIFSHFRANWQKTGPKGLLVNELFRCLFVFFFAVATAAASAVSFYCCCSLSVCFSFATSWLWETFKFFCSYVTPLAEWMR